ncbi:MAG: copper chaperone PCu(A)C [Betaproteobacteria bacterium]|nr:copper chaperone PCu(A)C [Betaproteobacteria bacterium]
MRNVTGGTWITRALLAAAGLAFAWPGAAQELGISNAWVRAPVAGQKVVAGYVELTSATAAALVGAGSPLAARVEMHATTVEGGVMKMRPVERIELPAKTTVKLAPGGLHLMLVDLSRPLKEGERIPLTLVVAEDGKGKREVRVEAEVRGALGGKPHQRH